MHLKLRIPLITKGFFRYTRIVCNLTDRASIFDTQSVPVRLTTGFLVTIWLKKKKKDNILIQKQNTQRVFRKHTIPNYLVP